MALETKEFYTIDELTPELLMAVVSELTPRASAILGYVDRNANDTDKIRMKVRIYQALETLPIVGFADRTPLGAGFEADEKDVSPYHLKKGWSQKAGSPYLERAGNGFAITAEGVAVGTGWLEEQRINTLAAMWLTALNEKSFVWRDVPVGSDKPAERVLEMDYSDAIVDLTAPSAALNLDATNIYLEIDKMMEEFYDNTGFFPDIAFVSGVTLNTIKGHADVAKAVRAQATNEPDLSVSTRDELVVGGLKFVAMRGKYTKPDGSQGGPVATARAIVTAEAVRMEDGRGILRHECAANILNANNAERAYYGAFEVSQRPPEMALDVYDNGCPVIAHRKAVGHWQMWTP